MRDLPDRVADEEKIIRAIFSPHHTNKAGNRVRPAAFRSKPGLDEISVMRHDYMGSHGCKAKALDIEVANGNGVYSGLAVVTASAVRAVGSEVHDSRSEFWGHAHISHGVVIREREATNSRDLERLDERLMALMDHVKFYPDEDRSPRWNGVPL